MQAICDGLTEWDIGETRIPIPGCEYALAGPQAESAISTVAITPFIDSHAGKQSASHGLYPSRPFPQCLHLLAAGKKESHIAVSEKNYDDLVKQSMKVGLTIRRFDRRNPTRVVVGVVASIFAVLQSAHLTCGRGDQSPTPLHKCRRLARLCLFLRHSMQRN